MSKKCQDCNELFDEEFQVCPHCGRIEEKPGNNDSGVFLHKIRKPFAGLLAILLVVFIVTLFGRDDGTSSLENNNTIKQTTKSNVISSSDNRTTNISTTVPTTVTTSTTTKKVTTTAATTIHTNQITAGKRATTEEQKRMDKAVEKFFYMCVQLWEGKGGATYDTNSVLTLDGKEYYLMNGYASLSAFRAEMARYMTDSVIDKYWYSKKYLRESNGKLYVLANYAEGGQFDGVSYYKGAPSLPSINYDIFGESNGTYVVWRDWRLYMEIVAMRQYGATFKYVDDALMLVNIDEDYDFCELEDSMQF